MRLGRAVPARVFFDGDRVVVNFLNPVPTWVIMLGAALLIFAMNEVGFRLGRGKGPGLTSQDPSAVVQGAAFTVLALLLGFSFSLALGRYDARRAALVREATAIGYHVYPRQITGRERCRGHPRRLTLLRCAANRVCSSGRQSRTARGRRRKIARASARYVARRDTHCPARPALDDGPAFHQASSTIRST